MRIEDILNQGKKIFSVLLFAFLAFQNLCAQEVEIIHFSELETLLNEDSDELKVINFWATWCVPCVKEIPYFVELQEKYRDKNVGFYFISLDYKKHYDTRVLPFVNKYKMEGLILLLDELFEGDWTKKVEQTWAGNIPITLFINNARDIHDFYDGEIEFDKLDSKIQLYTN